ASPVESVRFKPGAASSLPSPEPEGVEVAILPTIHLPGTTSPREPATALEQAVDRGRLRDPPFQRLSAEAHGGEGRLSGTVERWQDVDDLAGALMRLPGVERVVLDRIQTGPPGR